MGFRGPGVVVTVGVRVMVGVLVAVGVGVRVAVGLGVGVGGGASLFSSIAPTKKLVGLGELIWVINSSVISCPM